MRKTVSLSLVSVFLLICCPLQAAGNPGQHHPDGVTGRLNGWFSASYASVSAEQNVAVVDKNRFGIGLMYPAAGSFTIEAGYTLENNHATFHDYFLAARVYLKNPLKRPDNANPDGAVGGPIVSVRFGGKIPDSDPRDHRYRISLAAFMPISRKLTLGAGWQYYQEENPRQVDEFFGILNYFPKAYRQGRGFQNPDGVEGSPMFSLRGGGSDSGVFGQLDILVPLKPGLTLGFSARGERVPSPYVRSTMLGVKIYFYPGNA